MITKDTAHGSAESDRSTVNRHVVVRAKKIGNEELVAALGDAYEPGFLLELYKRLGWAHDFRVQVNFCLADNKTS